MAMCGSGSIGELSAPQGGCSSISAAACGSTAGPKCMTALAAAAGKSLPINMTTCWYGYIDALIITPTTFTSIPATCTTCVITTCAPAFNTACACTACGAWLVPDTPITPTPAGNTHNIIVCANSGAARCGTVCYDSVCGAVCTITFCQLACPNPIKICTSIVSGGATSCNVGVNFIMCKTSVMGAGESYWFCGGGGINTTGTGGGNGWWCAICAGACVAGGTVNANSCCVISSACYNIAQTTTFCIMACICNVVTTCANCGCATYCEIAIIPITGNFCAGSPTCGAACTC
jgi:hypothetical protein